MTASGENARAGADVPTGFGGAGAPEGAQPGGAQPAGVRSGVPADAAFGFDGGADLPGRADGPADEDVAGALWRGDRSRMPLAARKALLRLVSGPFVESEENPEEWNALIAYRHDIEARLNDLFLELDLDPERGIAFARNARADTTPLPKAARSQNMTVADTVMVLTLRRELLTDASSRVIVGREELIDGLMQYRPIERLDEAAFRKRLEQSWSRMVQNKVLRVLPDAPDRAEVSPVLALVFGADEVRAVSAAFERMLAARGVGADADDAAAAADADAERAESAGTAGAEDVSDGEGEGGSAL